MEVRIKPKQHLPGIWFLRIDAVLAAPLKVIVHGIMKRLLQFRDRLTLKRNDVLETQHFTGEDVGVLIELFPAITCAPISQLLCL